MIGVELFSEISKKWTNFIQMGCLGFREVTAKGSSCE